MDEDALKKTIAELEKEVSDKEIRKSKVRVRVTYGAALFLFVGGPTFIVYLVCTNRSDDAINLFHTLLPVAAAIVSFWFAGRGEGTKK